MSDEIKTLIDAQGKAFEEFKATLDGAKKHDVLTDEKIARIEKTLDDAIEAKTALEAGIAAERKAREELDLRLARRGKSGDDDLAAETKVFNETVRAHAMAKGISFSPLSEDDYAKRKAAQAAYLRKGEKMLDNDEVKSMSVGSDPDGGYFVTPDVNGRIVTKVWESSQIRQIADVMSIGSDKLEGIEDRDEADCGWVAEQGSRTATDTPQVGKWSIEAFEMYASPKASQKILDDAVVPIEIWLANKVAEKFARKENNAFVVGDGAGKPRGFAGGYTTSADSGSGVTWGTLEHVLSGGSADFASSNPVDKLYDIVGALKAEYLTNARWVTRRSVVTKIRKFKDSTGQYLWQPALVAGQPDQLLGYPVTRAEDMPTLAAGSLSLAFGDFKRGYQIVDRLGVRTLRDPYTAKPFVVFYSIKRVGGGVVDFDAIKLMKFAAS